MIFNPKKYYHHLADAELEDNEKIELITALWGVAQCFADQAFGLTPTQTSAAMGSTKIRKTQATLLDLDCPANDNAKNESKGEIRKETG